MKLSLLASTLVVSVLTCVSATAAPAASLQDCVPLDEQAAREWKPMQGSLPAIAKTIEGGPVLEGRCNFLATQIERASWDRALKMDLSDVQGIQFEVFCPDTTPVSYFSIYLQSGGGWYHASFFPERDGEWHTVKLDKEAFEPEGTPAGWDHLKTLRLSAWRGGAKDTFFRVRGLRPIGKLGADASVVVLRGDAGAEHYPEQAASFREIANRVSDFLRDSGIPCVTRTDSQLTSAQLIGTKLLVLPHNSYIPEDTVAVIRDYIHAGGKVLAFYSVPASLRPALNLAPGKGIKATAAGGFSAIQPIANALPGAPERVAQSSQMISATPEEPGKTRVLAHWLDSAGKPSQYPAILASTNCIYMSHVLNPAEKPAGRQLMVAMAGALVPDLWRELIDSQLREMAALGNFRELAPLTNHIIQTAKGNKAALQELSSALQHREQALRLLREGAYPAAQTQAAQASTDLLTAFCAAQQPMSGEFRGFWCHSATGIKGLTWDQAISTLAQNGFNAIMPNMLWGGAAFYPSKYLPVAQPSMEHGDQIRECLDACRKHGVAMHVWKVNWYLGTWAPRDFVERLKTEGRLQVSSAGEPHNWLCPSHPENQKLEIASMVEVAKNYAVDGLHFDYIRYPGRDHCYCSGCRERFEKDASLKVQSWPADVLAQGILSDKWNEWRRGNITKVVKAVSEQARAVRPSIKISAAVFRSWETDRNTVAQDWKVWCDKGYLDFVCPMDYTPSDRNFENMVARQIQWAGKVPCYPGLGVSASRSKFGPDRAIEQILLTRKHKTGGFMIFNYAVKEERELVPLLGSGITAKARE